MRFQREAGAVAVAMALTCASAFAQDAVVRESHGWTVISHGSMEPANTLVIKLEHGAIELTHGSGPAFEYQIKTHVHGGSEEEARRIAQENRIDVSRSGDAVKFRGEMNQDVSIAVPAAIRRIEARTAAGAVKIDGISAQIILATDAGPAQASHIGGNLSLTTGGGAITLQDCAAPARLETGAGAILVDAAQADVMAETGGGAILVTAAKGNLKLETGGGNVTVRQGSGSLWLETGGGNIEIGDVAGPITLKSGGGTIRLGSSQQFVRASTAAGSIECHQLGSGANVMSGSGSIIAEFARNLHFVASRIETGAGDILLTVPANFAAQVLFKADNPWGHTIRADFPSVQMDGHSGSKLQAKGAVNGGGPLLSVETGDGSISLEKAK
jgi:DUF4097 and DUF4098 domain-containing protein YvlB